jgi:nitroreductase
MEILVEAIRHRKSTRSYTPQHLQNYEAFDLNNFIVQNRKGLIDEDADIRLVETNAETDKKMKLNYGIVKNNHSYLIGTAKNSSISRMNYGYLLEKSVLKATSLGLSSCWIGYFDDDYFHSIGVNIVDNIPAIAIVGYANESSVVVNKLLRKMVKSTTRKEWKDLFFAVDAVTPLAKEAAGIYAEALELLRWAPSAGNTQPWRIVIDKDRQMFHFYKQPIVAIYEKKGLHDVDMGIAISHFDIALKSKEIAGIWSIDNPSIAVPDKWTYMISWKRD